jgi:hypothetical protein
MKYTFLFSFSLKLLTVALLSLADSASASLPASTTPPTISPVELESSQRFYLSVAVDKPKFTQGEPIVLHLTLKSGTDPLAVREGPSEWQGLGAIVQIPGGGRPDFSPKLSISLKDGSWHPLSLLPGQSKEFDYPVSDVYDMEKEGTYSITCEVEIWKPNQNYSIAPPQDRIWLRSNSIKVEVEARKPTPGTSSPASEAELGSTHDHHGATMLFRSILSWTTCWL